MYFSLLPLGLVVNTLGLASINHLTMAFAHFRSYKIVSNETLLVPVGSI